MQLAYVTSLTSLVYVTGLTDVFKLQMYNRFSTILMHIHVCTCEYMYLLTSLYSSTGLCDWFL